MPAERLSALRGRVDGGPARVLLGSSRGAGSPRWRLARRMLTWAFFILVLVLIVHQARSIDWAAVGTALRQQRAATVLPAAALAALSHALYACYELIGRHLTRHGLPARRSMAIGAVSYAFNLNLGSLIGGFALRYRLYARAGLPAAQVAQVIASSLVTNWLGYLALAGALFAWRPPALPPHWQLDSSGLRWLGMGMLAVGAAYVCACAIAPRREWNLRGHRLITPSARTAGLQLGLSALNWLAIAAVLWVLLQQRVDFPSVAAVFLVAAVAGVVAHVPAGLGVLEAVFIAMLSHRVPQAELLAALIVYRALYYLAPLAVAGVLLWRLERCTRS